MTVRLTQTSRGSPYIVASYIALLLYFLTCRYLFLGIYIRSLFEDSYVEWAQFYLLAATAVLCLQTAKAVWNKERRRAYLYVLIGVLCALVAAEEISWGQRILGFESPWFLQHYNAQGESDLHNVIGEPLAKVVDYEDLLALFALGYGVALPLIAFSSSNGAVLLKGLRPAIPPMPLTIGFLLGAISLFLSRRFSGGEEIGELFVYLSVFNLLLLKQEEESVNLGRQRGNFSRTIVLRWMSIVILATLSTVGTDMRGWPYGRGVTAYDWAYAHEYMNYGLYKEAVEQYEKALGVGPISPQYSFLKNFKSAVLEAESARTDIGVRSIDGDSRISLSVPPPSKITYQLTLPENSALRFGVTLDPAMWTVYKGDGVSFEVYVENGGAPERLLVMRIDPKRNVADRKWLDAVVDVSRYGGREVRLSFVTTPDPGDNADYDWAWWSDPRLVGSDEALKK